MDRTVNGPSFPQFARVYLDPAAGDGAGGGGGNQPAGEKSNPAPNADSAVMELGGKKFSVADLTRIIGEHAQLSTQVSELKTGFDNLDKQVKTVYSKDDPGDDRTKDATVSLLKHAGYNDEEIKAELVKLGYEDDPDDTATDKPKPPAETAEQKRDRALSKAATRHTLNSAIQTSIGSAIDASKSLIAVLKYVEAREGGGAAGAAAAQKVKGIWLAEANERFNNLLNGAIEKVGIDKFDSSWFPKIADEVVKSLAEKEVTRHGDVSKLGRTQGSAAQDPYAAILSEKAVPQPRFEAGKTDPDTFEKASRDWMVDKLLRAVAQTQVASRV